MEHNQIRMFGLSPSSASPNFSSNAASSIPQLFPHVHSSNAVPMDICGTSYSSVNKLKSGRKHYGDEETKKHKIAFQTRSQVDVLDDGYRWRKYGQKTVKNSNFPRLVSSSYHQTVDECSIWYKISWSGSCILVCHVCEIITPSLWKILLKSVNV